MSKTAEYGTVTRVGHDSSSFYERRVYRSGRKCRQSAGGENAPNEVNVIYNHDSRNMEQLPDNSLHLMVTSPPYNVGKEYDDDLTLDDYIQLLAGVLSETYRVLVDGGRACINIANIGRTPYLPLHSHIIDIADDLGFLMRGEIIWDKGASAGVSCAWGSWQSASNPTLRDVHEYILVFSKNLYKRHPIKENTITRDEFMEYTKSIWRFSATSARKIGHPAPYPVELPRRLIHLYSYSGDIILDPFMGSGTTAVAALDTDRKFIGYELNQDYVKLANARVLEKQSTLEI